MTTQEQREDRRNSPNISQHRNSQDADFNNKGRKLRPASKNNRDSKDLRESKSNNRTNREVSSSLEDLDLQHGQPDKATSVPGSNNRRARSSLGG